MPRIDFAAAAASAAAVIVLSVGVALLATNWLTDGGARASHGPVGSGFIDIVAIDTDRTNDDASTSGTGNTATAVGPIDECNTIANVGDTLIVDVIADEVPPFNQPTFSDGLTGFAFDVVYNPTVIKVIGFDANMLLAAIGRNPLPLSEPVPDVDGDWRVD